MRTACFWNKLPQVRQKMKDCKPNNFQSLGAIKQKHLNRIAKVDYGYLFLLEENLSVINVSSHQHHCQIFTTMYNTFTPLLQEVVHCEHW
jgi:hypothetical protein